MILESAWLLLLIPLVARYFAPNQNGDDAWRTRVDIPLTLFAGVLMAALSSFWLARYHLKGWPLTASDFAQYCQSVASLQSGGFQYWVSQRSVPSGWLAGMLSRDVGVVGGLVLSTLIAQAVTGSAIFLWARAAHGRVAGIASVLVACAVAPLVVLSRTVTFYPMFVAACALCSAGAMLAVRYRNLPALFMGGLGVGVALLMDVRGLYWALAGLVITCIGVVPRYIGHLPKRLGVVLAPIAASWFVARATTLPNAQGLDYQTRFFIEDAVARVPGASVDLGAVSGQDFLWGRSYPWEIPGAILRLMAMTAKIPPELAQSVEVAHNRETYLLPWIGPVVGGLLLWVLRMRLRPWTMAAFLISLGPFAVAYVTTATTLAHPRYLAVAMLAVPVALGVPLGAFVGAPSPPKVGIPLLGFLLVLVLGVVPSWLSPVAGWRVAFKAEMEPRVFQLQAVPMDNQNAYCVIALARDRYRERTWSPYPYPVALPELPNVTLTGEPITPTATEVATPPPSGLPPVLAPAAPADAATPDTPTTEAGSAPTP